MSTTKDAIRVRIQFLREYQARLEGKVLAAQSLIADLVQQRDGLTDVQAGKIDALQARGVLKVEE